MSTGLYVLDKSGLAPDIIEGLKNGTMVVKNNTIRWARGRHGGEIVKHAKFTELGPEALANAGQTMQLATTVASAAFVAGVVVVATTYLAAKIESVQRTVDAVASAVNQQDMRECLKVAAEYVGEFKAAREALNVGAVSSAAQMRPRLSVLRHRSLHYIAGLCKLLDRPNVPAAEMDSLLGLMTQLLDMMPIAMLVERDLGVMVGETVLFEHATGGPVSEYRKQLSDFKQWCVSMYERLARGEGGPADALRNRRSELRQLFESPVNHLLLAGLSRSAQQGDAANEGSMSLLQVQIETDFQYAGE